MAILPIFLKRNTGYNLNNVSFLLDQSLINSYLDLHNNKRRLNILIENIVNTLEKEISKTNDELLRATLIKLRRKIKKSSSINLENIDKTYIKNNKIDEYYNMINDLREKHKVLKQDFEFMYQKHRELLSSFYKNSEITDIIGFTTSESASLKIDKYLDTPPEKHKKNLRKLDLFLLKYITRATMKTSPFANLTSTQIVVPTENDINTHTKDRVYASINYSLLLKLIDKICIKECMIDKFEYSTNDTIIQKDDMYCFTVPTNNSTEKINLYNNSQKLNILKKNIFIEEVIKITGQNKVHYKEIINSLSNHFDVNMERIKKILLKLINENFLIRNDCLDESSEKLLEDFIHLMESLDCKNKDYFNLKNILHLTSEFENKIIIENIIKIRKILKWFIKEYNLPEIDDKNLIYFDTISISSEYSPVNNCFFEMFQNYQYLISVFDPAQRSRYLVSDNFKEKYSIEKYPDNPRETSEILRFLGEKLSQSEESKIFMGEFPWDKIYDNKILFEFNNIANKLFDYIESNKEKNSIILKDRQIKQSIEFIKNVNNEEIFSHSFFISKLIMMN